MTPHVSLQRLEETCSWERRGVEREKDTKEEKETIISKHLSRILEKNNSLCWLKVVEVYSAALLWTTYRLKCFSESSSHILHCNLAWKRAVGEFPSQLKDKLPTLGSKLWMDPESQARYELNMIVMGLLQWLWLRSFWFAACVCSSIFHMNQSEGLDIWSSKGRSIPSHICYVFWLKTQNQSCRAFPS